MDITLETRAAADANNHAKFTSFFLWRAAPANKQAWTIWYVSHRDARLTEESNAAAIAKAMAPLAEADPDGDTVREESHGCSMVGHQDAWVVRVYNDDGSITPAYEAVHELKCRLETHPILNEDDLSERESNATWENLKQAATHFIADGAHEDDTLCALSDWLHANVPCWDESSDDQGGYPDDSDIVRGLRALGKCDEDEVAAQAHSVG